MKARAFTKQFASFPNTAVFSSFFDLANRWNNGPLFDINMLDVPSQVVLGDFQLEDSQSTPLTAFGRSRHSFCGDPEGWGPLSLAGFYLTPCFLDVIVAVVAVWGVIGGACALWLLLKKRIPQSVAKNWHFYAKLVRCTQIVFPSQIKAQTN